MSPPQIRLPQLLIISKYGLSPPQQSENRPHPTPWPGRTGDAFPQLGFGVPLRTVDRLVTPPAVCLSCPSPREKCIIRTCARHLSTLGTVAPAGSGGDILPLFKLFSNRCLAVWSPTNCRGRDAESDGTGHDGDSLRLCNSEAGSSCHPTPNGCPNHWPQGPHWVSSILAGSLFS